ncbi:DMT family transporter [Methylophaga nitratireducenticrescens]|uniref:EamA-like transporter family n=1 Tax=Methylophaga nitratireducenticrescens TaxID=754476 RepID=I1XMD6_METNJ|nr:DMT family transporter [Methylophaga nitratireducenticrescens]AFI85555.1 EamA family transporter [Methylophaga nitratireducenticrescens]AUZ85292.1 EamA family transporter [Methylophaga nitratireducenticrescens]
MQLIDIFSNWPDYALPVMSAVLWALSAPVVNLGLNKIPSRLGSHGVLLGLFVALSSAAFCLAIWAWLSGAAITINWRLAAAGVFTFPVATGMYYVTAVAFKGQAEVAAQFAKLKPLISIIFAAVFVGEVLNADMVLPIALIAAGISIFIVTAIRGKITMQAVLLGALTAMAWSVGETFMILGLTGSAPLTDNFVSLVFGALAIVPVMLIFSKKLYIERHSLGWWLLPFAVHGIISFSLAYAFFFAALESVGMLKTVVINAFWPVLALLFTYVINRVRSVNYKVPYYAWFAGLLLCSGSAVQIWNMAS